MDRLKTLEVFKAVVDQGSFVKGAEFLHLSKPAVTRAVQDLENLLGVQLLQRTTRRLTLTSTGQSVLSHAQGLLASYEALAAMSLRDSMDVAGEIRLVAPVSYGVRLLGPALAGFIAEHPSVKVDLHLADAATDVVEGRADLAFCTASEVDPWLIARKVASVDVGVFASPAWLAEHGVPQSPEQLAPSACLVYQNGRAPFAWTFRHARSGEACRLDVQGTLNSNNGDALVSAASHGVGVVRLPVFLAEQAVARGELVQTLQDWSAEPIDLVLAYSSRRHQPLRVRRLIDHLAQALGGAGRTAPPAPAHHGAPPQRQPGRQRPHAAGGLRGIHLGDATMAGRPAPSAMA